MYYAHLFSDTMPRFTKSEQWLAGYISGRIGELRRVLDKLRSASAFSRDEMAHMRDDVLCLDAAVRPHWRDARPHIAQPMRRKYEGLLRLTLDELTRRERHDGLPSGESAAMYEYRRSLENPNCDGYESDGQHEQPLEDWTMPVTCTEERTDNTGDLRRILERREATGCVHQWDNWRPSISSAIVRPWTPQVALAIEAPLYGGNRTIDSPLHGDDQTIELVSSRTAYSLIQRCCLEGSKSFALSRHVDQLYQNSAATQQNGRRSATYSSLKYTIAQILTRS